MKKITIFLLCYCIFLAAKAQPSDDQVKKDVGGRLPNKVAFRFGKHAFTRFNKTNNTKEWLREVIITMTSEAQKEILKEQYAYAVYEMPTPEIYRFYKVLNTIQHLKGLKDPTDAEIKQLIAKDPAGFYTHYFNNMVKLIEPPHAPDIPYQRWHTVNSVEIFYKVKFEHIISDIETETRDQIISIRLYRTETTQPWNRFYAQMIESDENVIHGSKQYTPQQIDKMRQKTIGQQLLENAAAQKTSSLPAMNVPQFQNLMEMTVYLHNVLREGDANKLEAVLLQVLSPDHFEPGSKSRLNEKGKELLQKAIVAAYNGDATYARQYCRNAGIDKKSTPNRVYVTGCINSVVTMLAGSLVNEGYQEGQPVKKWKLNELSVGTRQDEDAIAYINSISDRKKLCPSD